VINEAVVFQGDHIRLRANASCFSCPAPNSLGGQGTGKIRRSPEGMVALQRQVEKFSVSPFTKGDDLRRFLKAAVKGWDKNVKKRLSH
jgi:hypothetical protein